MLNNSKLSRALQWSANVPLLSAVAFGVALAWVGCRTVRKSIARKRVITEKVVEQPVLFI